MAILMGMQFLLMSSSSGVLEARRVVRERAFAVTETIELVGPGGKVELRVGGTGLFGRLAQSAKVSRTKVDSSSLDSLIAALESYSKKLKNRMPSFAMTLQVIAAQRAATYEEYRAILDQLPVTIERSTKFDDLGRHGVQTEYRISGVARARLFRVDDSKQSQQNTIPDHSRNESENGLPDETIGAPTVDTASHGVDDCEYWDEDEQYLFQGECATQQDLDDAMTEIVVADYEVDEALLVADEEFGDWIAWCIQEYGEESCYEPQYHHQQELVELAADESELEGAPVVTRSAETHEGCGWEALKVGVKTAAHLAVRYRLVMLLTTVAAPPASAVIFTALGFVGSAILVVTSVHSLLVCMEQPT